MLKNKKLKKTTRPKGEVVLTKPEFLKSLDKVIGTVKKSSSKEKRKTSE
jgi:hypothetical protein